MRDHKPSRVGQTNGLWGLALAFLIPFFTVTLMTPPKVLPGGQKEGVLPRFARVVKTHPVFFIFLGAVGLVGGVSIGRLMGGGKKISEGGEFADLDKL